MLGVPGQAKARKLASAYALAYPCCMRTARHTELYQSPLLRPYYGVCTYILDGGGGTSPRTYFKSIIPKLGTLIARVAVARFSTKPWLCGGRIFGNLLDKVMHACVLRRYGGIGY